MFTDKTHDEEMDQMLTREDFAACLQTTFRVVTEPPLSLDLQLIGIEAGSPNPGYEVFALHFRGPTNPFMPQRTYRLAHERLGEFDLFLVPVSRDKEGFTYEAIINRLIQSK